MGLRACSISSIIDPFLSARHFLALAKALVALPPYPPGAGL